MNESKSQKSNMDQTHDQSHESSAVSSRVPGLTNHDSYQPRRYQSIPSSQHPNSSKNSPPPPPLCTHGRGALDDARANGRAVTKLPFVFFFACVTSTNTMACSRRCAGVLGVCALAIALALGVGLGIGLRKDGAAADTGLVGAARRNAIAAALKPKPMTLVPAAGVPTSVSTGASRERIERRSLVQVDALDTNSFADTSDYKTHPKSSSYVESMSDTVFSTPNMILCFTIHATGRKT